MHTVLLSDSVVEVLHIIDKKSVRICKRNLKKLQHPYPGRGPGDKEKIVVDGEEVYRLHIGRTYTAFYVIDKKTVRVVELLPIDAAHKKYGF